MNAICDTTAKSETLSVKGCKVKITYAPADTDCLDAIQKLLQTTILRTAGHTAVPATAPERAGSLAPVAAMNTGAAKGYYIKGTPKEIDRKVGTRNYGFFF